MSQKKVIIEQLEALDNLKEMAENYEEIAANRMQKIKDQVLKTRDYLAELSDIFVDLKSSYPLEVNELLKKRRKGDKTLAPILKKNGRILMVYMSSNGRLYGAVTKKTFELFVQDLRTNYNEKVDLVIIGSAGREMYESMGPGKPYEYIDIPDDNITVENVRTLMKKFLQYDEVHIYYGKFGNVIRQSAISTSITGEDIFETETPTTLPREDRFIFEPVFEKVFRFFETQIMSALFSQTFSENQLARQASRVNAMEEALIHIEEETKKIYKQKLRMKHLLQNKKQLETMSGFILWDVG